MSLSTTLKATISARLVGATVFGGAPSYPLSYGKTVTLQTGTTSGKADKLYAAERTLVASDDEDLDLAGVLLDPLGQTLTFAKIKSLYIEAATGNTNNVLIKPAASNGFLGPFNSADDQIALPPGGFLFVAAPVAGWAVGAGTGDLLNIANSGGTTGVTYKIIAVGTSA